MKRVALWSIVLCFVSIVRSQGFLYFDGPCDTLTVVPSEYVVGYSVCADGAYVMLSTGKTLVVPDAAEVTDECPYELPRFAAYRFSKKCNDQLFQSVTAPAEALLLDTVRLSVGQIGKYLTASFLLTDDAAVARVGSVCQVSDTTRQRMATPLTYTIGRKNWRLLQVLQDAAGGASYRYVPFGRQVTVCVDFLTDHPTGTHRLYRVPHINITTDSGSLPTSRTTYLSGTITIDGCGVYPDLPATSLLIKGRGNTSWSSSTSSKNSYHIKFSEKQKPLGMTAGKHWVLLGNKQAGSMLCNALAQKAAALAGCASVCHIVPVELYMNGTYRGSYNLTEKVGLSNNSVSLDDESCAAMLELDTYPNEPIWRSNTYNIATKIHDPDFDDDDPSLLITKEDIMADWDDAAYTLRYGGREDYTGRFDVNRLVSFLFTNELCCNTELQHAKSVFLYSENVLDKGFSLTGIDETPWIFGPMWDCDWSFGYQMGSSNYFVNAIDDGYYSDWLGFELNGFWYHLRYKSSAVDRAYYTLWHHFMNDGRLQELIDYAADYYAYAASSFKHNSYNVTNERDGQDYAALSKRAASWLRERADYVFGTLKPYDIDEKPQEQEPVPCMTDTPDGLPDVRLEMASQQLLYDLSGRRIRDAHAVRPGIYITADGRKVRLP